jgi:hypothetical protein
LLLVILVACITYPPDLNGGGRGIGGFLATLTVWLPLLLVLESLRQGNLLYIVVSAGFLFVFSVIPAAIAGWVLHAVIVFIVDSLKKRRTTVPS